MMPGLPLIGNTLEFQKDRKLMLERGYEQFGTMFSIQLVTQKMAILFGEEAARIFFEKTDTALRMDKAYGMLKALFGDIAFTAPPEFYRRQRPILHMPFKGSKMGGYLTIMEEEVTAWLTSLGNSGEIELVESLGPVIQNVAAHALMGKDFRQRVGRDFWEQYAYLGKALDVVLPPNLPLPKFIRRDRAKKRIRAMIQQVIDVRRQSDIEYPDMLHDYVNARYEDGTPLTDDEVISLIMGLMFAGHETTLGQASWLVAELLLHPDYLATTQTEIDTLPTDRALSARDFSALPHLEWAVYETTRMHPSADTIFRYVEEDIEIGEYRIPAGWVVMLSSDVHQRLEEVFTQPDGYDPERFSPARAEDRAHKHAISGFGGGVHKCTGMNFANLEMSVITALLLRHFELEMLTPNPQTTYGLGAARPTEVRVRYKRRTAQSLVSDPTAEAVLA